MVESHETKTQPTIAQRINAAKTGFVSVTQKLKTWELLGAIKKRQPNLELSLFQPEDHETWSSDLPGYLGKFDALIVVCGNDREITRAQLRELATANTSAC
jgi:hypothetical protein